MSTIEVRVEVRCERVIGRDGSTRAQRTVFCPRASRTVPLPTCEHCAFLAGGALETGAQAILCEVDRLPQTPANPPARTLVGALIRGSATCVAADLRFADLRKAGLEQALVPVVRGPDDSYVGSIAPAVVGLAYELLPTVRGVLLVADVVMTRFPAVFEDQSVLAAAAAMTQAHTRHLPVITRSGRCAGLVDDIALLRRVAGRAPEA